MFTVAKLHYVNGVVYFAAQEGDTDLATLAKHSAETTKSGNVKHPMACIRTLVRIGFAVILALLFSSAVLAGQYHVLRIIDGDTICQTLA
jgi:hypothetical protein